MGEFPCGCATYRERKVANEMAKKDFQKEKEGNEIEQTKQILLILHEM